MSFVTKISPPTGSITAYLGTADPPGWVIMNGVARSNNADGRYNALNAMGIGTGGSGTSSYTPPDYKTMFLRGNGSAPNADHTSAALGTFQSDAYLSHNHGVNDPGHRHTTLRYEIFNSAGGVNNSTGANGNSSGSNQVNSSTTGISIQNKGGSETRPFNYAVNWILKL